MTAVGTEEDSSGEETEKEFCWQTTAVLNKRNVCKSPIGNNAKRRHISDDELPSTSNANRFASLQNNKDDQNQQSTTRVPEPIKPPPLFIPGVTNIVDMIKNICKVIPSKDFNYKSLRNGEVKLSVNNIESYRKLVKCFDDKEVSYHTYQIRQERSYRVVLKGLHHTTPVTDIKAEIISLGFDVRNVHNAKSRVTKAPLSMFFVDLDPRPNNNEIYNVTRFRNAIVKVEPPNKTTDFVQCFRCQEYGHTQGYCKKPFRCVKCAQYHPTTECKKAKEIPPCCAHCQQKHTANYRGCEVYQELVRKRQTPARQAPLRFATNIQQDSQFNATATTSTDHKLLYSDMLRQQNSSSQNNLFERIEVMLNKQLELTNNLLNMMSLLINKLCN